MPLLTPLVISHYLLFSAGDAPGVCSETKGAHAINPPSIPHSSIQTEKDSRRPPGIGSCSSLDSVLPEGKPAAHAGPHQQPKSLSVKFIQELHPNITPATANAHTGKVTPVWSNLYILMLKSRYRLNHIPVSD